MEDNEKYIKSRLSIEKALKNNPVLYEKKGKNEDEEKIELSDVALLNLSDAEMIPIKQEDGKVIQIIQINGVLENGENIEIILDEDGKDMACIFRGKFKLTPRLEREILSKAITGKIKGTHINDEIIRKALFPESMEDLEKEIEENNLIPKNVEETIKKIKSKDPKTNVEAVVEREEELEQEEQEETREELLLPDDVRDEVARIRSTEGARLKHVLLTKNPSSISDKLVDNAGLRDNGEPVYCLSFENRSLEIDSDRVVFVQGTRVIDDRRYDEDATRVLVPYRNSTVVHNVEDNENKVVYTDLDGHTTVEDMETEPRDLTLVQKESLARDLKKLDDAERQIRESDMPLELKIEECQKINRKRIELFNEHGLRVPEIRDEMRGDDEIGEEIQNDIKAGEEVDEDDGHDPREAKHERGEIE